MRLPVWRGHEHSDVPLDGFTPAIPEQPLGSRTEKPNQAVFIDDNEATRYGVEDDAKLRLDVLEGDGLDRLMLFFAERQQN